MTILTPQQLEAIQILADTVHVWTLEESIESVQDAVDLLEELRHIELVCPQRFRRALNLGRILVETGALAPDGHGTETVLAALEMVAKRQDLFDVLYAETAGCNGCRKHDTEE